MSSTHRSQLRAAALERWRHANDGVLRQIEQLTRMRTDHSHLQAALKHDRAARRVDRAYRAIQRQLRQLDAATLPASPLGERPNVLIGEPHPAERVLLLH